MTEADSQLILGCDGVWRTIDAQRAVEIVTKSGDESPAQRLVNAAVAEGIVFLLRGGLIVRTACTYG